MYCKYDKSSKSLPTNRIGHGGGDDRGNWAYVVVVVI